MNSQTVLATFIFGFATLLTPIDTLRASTAQITVTYPYGNEVFVTGHEDRVTWLTTNYPAHTGVNINLIKKVSSNPAEYELVRVIAKNTENDGSEPWSPSRTEKGAGYFIEVTCSDAVMTNGCSADATNASFAVNPVNTNLAHTMSAYSQFVSILRNLLNR